MRNSTIVSRKKGSDKKLNSAKKRIFKTISMPIRNLISSEPKKIRSKRAKKKLKRR
jgi:hypothetical protein